MRAQFVKTTERLMDEHPNVVLLLGDIGVHAFRRAFERYPDRCYNIGTAEQTMVGMAAGLAKEGFYPIVHSIAPFLVRRAYEQIHVDFGCQKLAGAFVTVGADNDYPALGATHRCPEDMILMGCVPGMQTYAPENTQTADVALDCSVNSAELSYIRLRKL